MVHADSNDTAAPQAAEGAPKIKAMRRQPCPCGSGKVFKNCHEGDPGYEVATDPASAVTAPPTTADRGPKATGPRPFQGPTGRSTGPARNTGTSHRRKV